MNSKITELQKQLAALTENDEEISAKIDTLSKLVLELRASLEAGQDQAAGAGLLTMASEAYTALCAAQEKQGDLAGALASCKAAQQMKEEAFKIELAQAAAELQALDLRFQEASRQKTELLERLSQQAKLLQHQAREDVLTGLYNRRYLDEQLWLEFERAQRDQIPLCVLMIDINRFKSINDLFSHKVGDEVLKSVGQILRSICRRNDFAARYGGDEFALFLPETTSGEGEQICKKIHSAVAVFLWDEVHSGLEVTISIGLADSQGKEDYEALLHAADEQLYRFKANRNDNPLG